MDRRYMALRVISTIFRVLAWLTLIVGLLAGLGALVAGFLFSTPAEAVGIKIGGPLAGIAAFVVGVIFAIMNFLFLYAGAEFISLFISMEENSRRMAFLMQQQYMPRQPQYTPQAEPPEYED